MKKAIKVLKIDNIEQNCRNNDKMQKNKQDAYNLYLKDKTKSKNDI